MRCCYPRCIFSTTFLLACFQSVSCSVLIILFSWLALISWNVFVPYLNLYLIWSHLIWSDRILDLPILLSYFIFQSTDCTSWTSENMWLSLLITLDIPHPLAFLEENWCKYYKLMRVLNMSIFLNVNLSQWCEHNPLSCDFIDDPIFRSPIGVRCSSQRVWSSAQKNRQAYAVPQDVGYRERATEPILTPEVERRSWCKHLRPKMNAFKPRFAYQVRCH